ncbi:unnamed protein product [Microthlaspi erraticum]|uniref:Glycine-rich domain-containing protein 1 n=1 Tax=Microthlaspi erraticum TaxID=1685480 RepID=A0A6D2I3H7_9BRAS|nr:unnamed protein product [Microthlaspi erraticum]
MDKEKDHEVEWLEAQKIEISVDLFAAAKKQLHFLETVDRNRCLYEGPALEKAIYRYNACWLPLLAKHSDSSSVTEGPLVPPLDCEWIWHCHRLNPVRYKTDCEQLYGRVLDNASVVSSVNGNSKLKTEALWKTLYPEEPYDLDVSERSSALENCTKYDLVSAVKRQSPFYYQVSRSHVKNETFLQEAVARYKGFLYLIKKNKEKSLRRFCVPTYDVDLIWHTHQLHPESYSNDMVKLLGKVLEHDDTDTDRGKGKKLDTGFTTTTSQWEETFGRRYWKAGAMYRGNTPSPLTTSPFASSSVALSEEDKEEFKKLIQFPEIEAVEVLLEVVGVRNVPDGNKGKLSVVFSKTQPDSLFSTERRLSIFSEVGEKQVAFFQCEARGELRFQLVSSSPSKLSVSREPKSLGFASFSVKEFLSPVVTHLSVEKWLELTPSKADSKPISIRVALSFTPATRFPSVLHMVESKPPSWKGSCFFPFIGKSRHGKSSTSVVDENETELITLQMSDGAALKDDHTGPRKVIGVTDSGESRVLAEYNGSFWSLLDSKWSLKQTNEDNPVFELLGARVVKVFSGRKLDYEPKHCGNRRSDQDFMTLVEFSKEHPYGKAVGLLDFRFGSIEAKENWLVVPGIVSAFILNTVLKKGGFGGVNATSKVAQCDGLKANGLKEESKESKLVATVENNVKANVTSVVPAAASKKGSGCGGGGCSGDCGNMVKAENASGCGGGCNGECGSMMKSAENASGCGGGCNGDCGTMVKATENAGGCGGGCNGDCGTMVKATQNASGCGGGCNGECGNMVKAAANAGGCGGGCNGDCGTMVKATQNASGCGGGCNGDCGNMVKAA